MSGERAMLDLSVLHGVTALTLGQTFPTGCAATQFLKDYCFNKNRQCRLKKGGGGNCKTFHCPQDICPWEVRVTRRARQGCPVEHYVSTLHDEHSDMCMVVANPSANQIKRLPSFEAAVMADKRVKRKTVVAIVQARDQTNLQHSRDKVYRAKDAVVVDIQGEWASSFSKIPGQLEELLRVNAGSLAYLETDQVNRFFRVFVAFGVAIQCQKVNILAIGFDGTHSRHGQYNGVILTLIGRDGNGLNVTLASAFVHIENEDNITWFLLRSIEAGINFQGVAVMCDRGIIQGAVVNVWRPLRVAIQIRFCTRHILMNIKKNPKLKLGGDEFENAIWRIREAETEVDYTAAVKALRDKFGDAVANYVAEIDPARWVVYPNVPENSRAANAASSDSLPFVPCPLFGWRSTIFVEADNNTMLVNGVREATPFEAINLIVKIAMKKARMRQELLAAWRSKALQLTPHAQKLWQAQQQSAGKYEVTRSSSHVWFVARQGYERYRKLETDKLSCTCATFVQVGIPCRHLMAVLHGIGFNGSLTSAFHRAYLVETYAEGYGDQAVELVVAFPPVRATISPPPYYKQVGRHQKRRIASGGDSKPGATYKCKSCSQVGHNRATCRRHNRSNDESNALFIGTQVFPVAAVDIAGNAAGVSPPAPAVFPASGPAVFPASGPAVFPASGPAVSPAAAPVLYDSSASANTNPGSSANTSANTNSDAGHDAIANASLNSDDRGSTSNRRLGSLCCR